MQTESDTKAFYPSFTRAPFFLYLDSLLFSFSASKSPAAQRTLFLFSHEKRGKKLSLVLFCAEGGRGRADPQKSRSLIRALHSPTLCLSHSFFWTLVGTLTRTHTLTETISAAMKEKKEVKMKLNCNGMKGPRLFELLMGSNGHSCTHCDVWVENIKFK